VQTENEKAVRDPIDRAVTKAIALGTIHDISTDKIVISRDVNKEGNALAQLVDALVWALQSQVSNTDGWVMVPVEPTPAMNFAATKAKEAGYTSDDCIYSAMLSAAPKAPQQVSNTPQDVPVGSESEAWKKLQALKNPYSETCQVSAHAWDQAIIEAMRTVIATPPQQQEQSGEMAEAVRYGEEAAFRFQQSTATASQECCAETRQTLGAAPRHRPPRTR
jgi:hypothetical protein